MTISGSAAGGWDRAALVRRLLLCLDMAGAALDQAAVGPDGSEARARSAGLATIAAKVLAEVAMLLHYVAPARQADPRIAVAADALAARVEPRARSEDVLAAICLDPGQALDHAFAHVLLGALGRPAPAVDALLADSLAMGAAFGPERLPHRRLERAWLARLWPRVWTAAPDADGPAALADSMLGRPLDALGATRADVYAFTHAVMYLADPTFDPAAAVARLPCSRAALAEDARAALAIGLAANDRDLTAEILLAWPLLDLDWGAEAVFALDWLTSEQDALGFVPGAAFDPALHGDGRPHAIVSSYHATLVMGFLCAALLGARRAPPPALPEGGGAEETACALLARLPTATPPPSWRRRVDGLGGGARAGLAPLFLAMALRDARERGDLGALRDALAMAAAAGIGDGTAPRQAAALLRRAGLLDRALRAGPAEGPLEAAPTGPSMVGPMRGAGEAKPG